MNEEQRIINILRCETAGTPEKFSDDLHRRLDGALRDVSASALDLAVLVRQLLRRWMLRDNVAVPVERVTPSRRGCASMLRRRA